MNLSQDDLLRRVVDVLDELGITYMVVGSFASGAYGEPRMTQDIDLVVELSYGHVGPLCERFPSPEYCVSPEAARQAIRTGTQFNIIHSSTGDKVDLMLARHETLQIEALRRRQLVPLLPGREVYAARPEDIILSKMQYYQEGGSEKHLRDITGILKVTLDVDRAYVERWAQELGLMEIWQAILRRLGRKTS